MFVFAVPNNAVVDSAVFALVVDVAFAALTNNHQNAATLLQDANLDATLALVLFVVFVIQLVFAHTSAPRFVSAVVVVVHLFVVAHQLDAQSSIVALVRREADVVSRLLLALLIHAATFAFAQEETENSDAREEENAEDAHGKSLDANAAGLTLVLQPLPSALTRLDASGFVVQEDQDVENAVFAVALVFAPDLVAVLSRDAK